MNQDHLNQEGYFDPTPHKAIRNISKAERRASVFGFRPVVYICSPYREDITSNTAKARFYCSLALKKATIPFAPHLLYPQFMDDSNEDERRLALFMCSVMLDKCAEVWVFGERISDGMKAEIQRAQEKRKTIKYFDSDGNRLKGGPRV